MLILAIIILAILLLALVSRRAAPKGDNAAATGLTRGGTWAPGDRVAVDDRDHRIEPAAADADPGPAPVQPGGGDFGGGGSSGGWSDDANNDGGKAGGGD